MNTQTSAAREAFEREFREAGSDGLLERNTRSPFLYYYRRTSMNNRFYEFEKGWNTAIESRGAEPVTLRLNCTWHEVDEHPSMNGWTVTSPDVEGFLLAASTLTKALVQAEPVINALRSHALQPEKGTE